MIACGLVSLLVCLECGVDGASRSSAKEAFLDTREFKRSAMEVKGSCSFPAAEKRPSSRHALRLTWAGNN